MNRLTLHTPNLQLVLQSTEEVLAQIEALSPTDRAHVSQEWLERVRASEQPDTWTHAFSMVELLSGATIGSCSFKGPPDSEGTVEISYGVSPEYRRQGLRYRSHARALIEFCHQHTRRSWCLCPIRCLTTPLLHAFLRKSGFQYVGEVIDPEDGLVCRWELVRDGGER